MTDTNDVAQTETVVAREKTPFEISLGVLKGTVTKLTKVESRAAEYDEKVTETNKTIMDFVQGVVPQTAEKNMMSVAKEQNAAKNKASKIRASGGTLAADAKKALAELTAVVESLTAPYAGQPADAPVDEELNDDAGEGVTVEE